MVSSRATMKVARRALPICLVDVEAYGFQPCPALRDRIVEGHRNSNFQNGLPADRQEEMID
jgi:hypothetical protein